MLDRDLAALYGVRTSILKRAVRRNAGRFPADFMFVLDKQEVATLRSQSVTTKPDDDSNWRCQFGTSNSDRMGLRYAPMAFTEQGVAMLSSVLNSERAILVNIATIGRTDVHVGVSALENVGVSVHRSGKPELSRMRGLRDGPPS
jgi:hypothetical protein